MKTHTLHIILAFLFSMFFIFSCSDEYDFGGDTESFNTVSVTASYQDELYQADPVTWIDTDKDGICYYDGATYFEEEALVTLTSYAHDAVSDPSVVKVMSYVVEFTAHEDSPEVPSKTIDHQVLLPANGSTTVSVALIDHEDKMNSEHPLNHTDYVAFQLSGGISYEYTITVTFTIVEIDTDMVEKVTVNFPLHYLDLADC